MHRIVRSRSLQWRQLLRSLVLPLLLLVAQQGAVLHELSHVTGTESHDSKKQSSRSDACDLCLAFAHVGAAAAPQPVSAPPLADLTHQLTPVHPVYQEASELPAQRSRSPPLFL